LVDGQGIVAANGQAAKPATKPASHVASPMAASDQTSTQVAEAIPARRKEK
jgi:hypothetical protein